MCVCSHQSVGEGAEPLHSHLSDDVWVCQHNNRPSADIIPERIETHMINTRPNTHARPHAHTDAHTDTHRERERSMSMAMYNASASVLSPHHSDINTAERTCLSGLTLRVANKLPVLLNNKGYTSCKHHWAYRGELFCVPEPA